MGASERNSFYLSGPRFLLFFSICLTAHLSVLWEMASFSRGYVFENQISFSFKIFQKMALNDRHVIAGDMSFSVVFLLSSMSAVAAFSCVLLYSFYLVMLFSSGAFYFVGNNIFYTLCHSIKCGSFAL